MLPGTHAVHYQSVCRLEYAVFFFHTWPGLAYLHTWHGSVSRVSYLACPHMQVARTMAPSVIYIDEAEKVFITDKKKLREFGSQVSCGKKHRSEGQGAEGGKELLSCFYSAVVSADQAALLSLSLSFSLSLSLSLFSLRVSVYLLPSLYVDVNEYGSSIRGRLPQLWMAISGHCFAQPQHHRHIL